MFLDRSDRQGHGRPVPDQFTPAATTDDYREGVAAFLEKRKPKFKGR